MVAFSRLAQALDGNEALQRRARLANLSLTVLSGGEATSVQVGERVVVGPGRRLRRCLQPRRAA